MIQSAKTTSVVPAYKKGPLPPEITDLIRRCETVGTRLLAASEKCVEHMKPSYEDRARHVNGLIDDMLWFGDTYSADRIAHSVVTLDAFATMCKQAGV